MAEDTKKPLQTHLAPFAKRFLKKCDLGQAINRYVVLVAKSGNADAK